MNLPRICGNRTYSSNRQMPQGPKRIIVFSINVLRRQVPAEINHEGGAQLRRPRSVSLSPTIASKNFRQGPHSFPNRSWGSFRRCGYRRSFSFTDSGRSLSWLVSNGSFLSFWRGEKYWNIIQRDSHSLSLYPDIIFPKSVSGYT